MRSMVTGRWKLHTRSFKKSITILLLPSAMLIKKNIHPFWYALSDYTTAAIAWALFFFLRKKILGQEAQTDHMFWLGVFFIPIGWLILYALTGSYNSVYKKSRLAELTITFVCTTIGAV